MEPLHPLCEVVWFYRATFWGTWLLGKPKDKAWLGQILGTLFGLPLLDKEEFFTSKLVQKIKVHLSPYQHLVFNENISFLSFSCWLRITAMIIFQLQLGILDSCIPK